MGPGPYRSLAWAQAQALDWAHRGLASAPAPALRGRWAVGSADPTGSRLLRAVHFLGLLGLAYHLAPFRRFVLLGSVLGPTATVPFLLALRPLLRVIARRELDYGLVHHGREGAVHLTFRDLDQLEGYDLRYDYFGWREPLSLQFLGLSEAQARVHFSALGLVPGF